MKYAICRKGEWQIILVLDSKEQAQQIIDSSKYYKECCEIREIICDKDY